MLSKILRLFAKDKQIESSDVVRSPFLITKELPQILDKAGVGLIVLDSNDCIFQINSIASLDLNIPKEYERLQKLEKKYSRLNTVNQMANLIPDPFDVRTSVQQQELSDRDIVSYSRKLNDLKGSNRLNNKLLEINKLHITNQSTTKSQGPYS